MPLPSLLLLLLPLIPAFYITIFRHRARSPPDISLRDNLFFLPFPPSISLGFFSFSFFLSLTLSLSLFFLSFCRSSAGLSWKIMLGRVLCISNARERENRMGRGSIANRERTG